MDPFVRFMSQKEDWVLLNSKIPQAERERISKILESHLLGEHVWLMSSGTESSRGERVKMVALSKRALLSAAQGVCDFFTIQQNDVILNLLPLFHVSGLMQKVRAFVSHAQHITAPPFSWDAPSFHQDVLKKQVTVTSLVPTQIYDLVRARLSSPPSLRLVFAGGGALADSLFEQACELGWPLVRTYGMTETCAMIAYKNKGDTLWRRLPHLQKWENSDKQTLQFYGESLLTGYLLIESDGKTQWVDPKHKGAYLSDDRGVIQEDQLELLGRDGEVVKIKGETVSLLEMNAVWIKYCEEQKLSSHSVIVAQTDLRDGARLVLVSEETIKEEQIAEFQRQRLPFQRISKIVSPFSIPRTALGKIKTAELLSQLPQD